MTDLQRLIEAVECGAVDYQCAASAFPSESAYGKCTWHLVTGAYGGSLDAAKALHDALLPGWRWNLWAIGGATVWFNVSQVYVYDGLDIDPARAWLLAILKAYQAQQVKE